MAQLKPMLITTAASMLMACIISCNLERYQPCQINPSFHVAINADQAVLTPDTIDTDYEYTWVLGNEIYKGAVFEPKNEKPGQNLAVLTVSGFGCEDTSSVSFFIGLPTPLARFSFTVPTDCFAPCTITFNNESENETSWAWTFSDDGTTSSQETPMHEFKKAGTFIVQLIVTGPGGSSLPFELPITIKALTFQRPFTVGSSPAIDFERIYGVDQSANGGYYAAVNNRKQTFLVKTDNQGTLITPNPAPITPNGSFIGTFLNQFGKVPGGYLMTGYTQHSSNEVFFYALKANGSFNFSTQTHFLGSTLTGNEFGFGFSETNNGQYVFCGKRVVSGADSSGLFLIQSSSGLVESWHKHLTFNEPNAQISAVLNYTGGYVIVGAKKNAANNNEAFFWKLNQNFAPVGQPVFLGTTLSLLKIIALGNDQFLLLGNDGGTGRSININAASGSKTWDLPYNGWKWNDVLLTADQRLIAVGAFSAAANRAGWMELKLTDGTEISSESYPLPANFSDTFATCVAQTADCGFVIGGYGFVGGQQQNLLIKTGPDGKLNN